MDILNMLYEGRLHPQETDAVPSPQLREAERRFEYTKKQILSQMDVSARTAAQELLEERSALSAAETQDAYIRGMRMGARLTAALLEDKNTSHP